MKKQFIFSLFLQIFFASAFLTSCSNDDDDIPPTPKQGTAQLTHIEIGLNNNEVGTIGQDFHFNMDVLVEDKVDFIQVDILQRKDETYSKPWTYSVKWDGHRGMKNPNVHHHFDVPQDAIEGKYDFIISVHEMDGAVTTEKRGITLYYAENLPVNPDLYALNVMANDDWYSSGVGEYDMPGFVYKKNDLIRAICRLSNVKDDGKMYLLLINKKFNHKPETVSGIDFNKVIVYGAYEHKDMPEVGDMLTPLGDEMNTLIVGQSTQDFNLPTPNPISGEKAWESGSYYFGVVYTNTTHNMSYFKYIDLEIKM